MEIRKDDIDQLKRDLYTHGYYLRKINEVKAKLYNVGMKLKDNEKASGISYDKVGGTSDPYHPSIASLIYEEETLQIELKTWEKRVHELGLFDIESYLSEQEYAVIENHFFNGFSYDYIAVNSGMNHKEISRRICNRALKKIIKNRKSVS